MNQFKTPTSQIIQDALENGREHGFKQLGLAARDALTAVYVPNSGANDNRTVTGLSALPEALDTVRAWLQYYDEIILPARRAGSRWLVLRNTAGATPNQKQWLIWDTKIAGPYDFVSRTRADAEKLVEELVMGLESDEVAKKG